MTSTKDQIINYLKNDFNTSQALLCLTDFIDEVNKSLSTANVSAFGSPSSISVIAECYFYVTNILETLGIIILSKKVTPSVHNLFFFFIFCLFFFKVYNFNILLVTSIRTCNSGFITVNKKEEKMKHT